MNPYLERLRSVGVLSRGRTRDRVAESRDADGYRTKATTDQLGNTVTEHADPTDRVDVLIRAPHVRLSAGEERQHG